MERDAENEAEPPTKKQKTTQRDIRFYFNLKSHFKKEEDEIDPIMTSECMSITCEAVVQVRRSTVRLRFKPRCCNCIDPDRREKGLAAKLGGPTGTNFFPSSAGGSDPLNIKAK
jgi:hypothetical protein